MPYYNVYPNSLVIFIILAVFLLAGSVSAWSGFRLGRLIFQSRMRIWVAVLTALSVFVILLVSFSNGDIPTWIDDYGIPFYLLVGTIGFIVGASRTYRESRNVRKLQSIWNSPEN